MTITIIKGQKADVTKPNPGLTSITIGISWNAQGTVDLDTSAFLLGSNGKVSKDEDLIFYNNPTTPFIQFLDKPQGTDLKQFKANLPLIPAAIEKIAFTLTIHDAEKLGQSFSLVRDAYLRIANEATGQELIRFDLGNQFSVETAIVVGELYRYNNEWKFNAVASGFSGGLKALCGNFGIEVEEEETPSAVPPKPPAPPAPKPPEPIKLDRPTPSPQQSAPPAPPVSLSKIELKKKGESINLQKKSGKLGEILINLNWTQKQSGGFFRKSSGVDLDLACLFELKDGQKGVIQALGESFGSLHRAPYIALDGDDRTGAVKSGENLRINGNEIRNIKRILVFSFIYEGVARWSEADGVVTIKQADGPEIIVKLDEHDNRKGMCAIAMITNVDDETFRIERLVQYYSGHRELDHAYGWGMRWVAGSK